MVHAIVKSSLKNSQHGFNSVPNFPKLVSYWMFYNIKITFSYINLFYQVWSQQWENSDSGSNWGKKENRARRRTYCEIWPKLFWAQRYITVPSLSKAEGRKQTKKNIKTDDRVECLIFHSIVNKIDRHIIRHADVLDKNQLKFILDFCRTKIPRRTKKITTVKSVIGGSRH